MSGLKCSNELCTLGPNTGSGKYTLDAENLSEGVHRLVVTATDNASNVASKEFTFDVRHGSPVSVGPGSVDPTTGQFKLSTTDVSLAGSGGVSRVYESRDLTVGAEGPLGPQWAISLGGGEGLTVLPTGSVVLASPGGGTTTFTRNSKGEFESPLGDGNLKIEAKEREPGKPEKGISEYLLVDAGAGTTTRFTQPEGTESTIPVYANQFGNEADGLKNPTGVAVDPSGDVWVADYMNNRVLKYSSAGTLLAAYGSDGPSQNEFSSPRDITINRTTGNVYVLDEGNNRIEELNSSGAFVRAFGWDVNDGGSDAFEICTTYCKAGIAGSGSGQLKEAKGLTVDSSGNVWISEYGNNRVQEFSESGSYIQKFGVEGTGEAQLKGPIGIAISGGNLYVAEYGNNRVQELSTAGKYIAQFGKAGSGNGEFNGLRGIAADSRTGNLYVADTGNNRVQEFSPAGKLIVKFGTAGSGNGQFSEPKGVAVSSSGGVYVTDDNNNRVEEWSRPAWLPTLAEGAMKAATTTYGYGPVETEGKTVVEPTEALAPQPAGVECGTKPSELKKGCRALTFNYSTETTASGENPTQWGQYKGRLTKIAFHVYNPAKGAEKMEEKAVAEYAYDSKGRLRAEWDPRISPALKTTYGYDAEGHVTALTPPNQQGLVFTYGTSGSDSSTGRLLKVTHAQPKAGASEEKVKETLHEQEQLTKYTVLPKLSGTAVVGVTMGVSSGTWSNSPIAYGYQWEDCNSEGKSCTAILGATNANYKVASSDVGHKLIAQVTAMNGDGAVAEASAASAVVASTGTKTEGTSYSPEPGSTVEYRVPVSGTGLPTLTKEEVEKWGQKDRSEREDNDPAEGVAVFPPDEPQGWPASKYTRATIDYMNEKGLTVNTAAPTGGIATSEYNEANEMVRTLSADNRAAALKETGKTVEASEKLDTKTEYNPEDTQILKVTGPEHRVKLSSGSEVEARAVTHDYYDEGAPGGETYNLVTKATSGALLSSGKEEDVRETITSYSGQENLGWKLRKPTSVTAEANGRKLTHTTVYEEQENTKKEKESTGNVVETRSPGGIAPGAAATFVSEFRKGGPGKSGEFEYVSGVAVSPKGTIWATDEHLGSGGVTGAHLYEYNEKEEVLHAVGAWGSGNGELMEPEAVAVDAKGEVWVDDVGNDRVEIFGENAEYKKSITGVKGNVIASKGHMWVGEKEYTEEGTFVKEVKGVAAVAGAGAIDSKGDFWVLNKSSDVVTAYNEEGKELRHFGSEGSGQGQFKEPAALTVSAEGTVWVMDAGNSRVEEFNENGEYIGQFGSYGIGEHDEGGEGLFSKFRFSCTGCR